MVRIKVVSVVISALNVHLIWTLNDAVCFQLLPVNAASTMGFNQQEQTTSQIQYGDSNYTIADHTNSAQIAMDNSLNGGYTISVKTEDQKPDSFKQETLQIIEPRHWTVNDRGVLVNADESEVTVKVEKPDWMTENMVTDGSTSIAGQEDGDTKYGVLIVKEEDAVCSDPRQIAVCRRENSDDIKHTCTVANVCGTEVRFLDKLHVPAAGQTESRPYACDACGNTYSTSNSRTVHEQTNSGGDCTGAASVEEASLSPGFSASSYHVHHHTE